MPELSSLGTEDWTDFISLIMLLSSVIYSGLVSRHGTAMNQRCSESNGLPKDEDTKLKKKRKLLVRNAEGISLVVTVFRIP